MGNKRYLRLERGKKTLYAFAKDLFLVVEIECRIVLLIPHLSAIFWKVVSITFFSYIECFSRISCSLFVGDLTTNDPLSSVMITEDLILVHSIIDFSVLALHTTKYRS